MAFGIWFVNKPNALIYIDYILGIHGKIYGKKNLVATYMQITILT
jgi:hypothetical protein